MEERRMRPAYPSVHKTALQQEIECANDCGARRVFPWKLCAECMEIVEAAKGAIANREGAT